MDKLRRDEDLALGCSPRCGPKAGSRVAVRESDPPGSYSLPRGLSPGDVVMLLNFDRGWWDVQRAGTGERLCINILNIGEILSTPAPVVVSRAMVKPDWRKIVEVAGDARRELAQCGKPGQRVRQAYYSTYVRARALGYHGDEDDWEVFVRRRGGR